MPLEVLRVLGLDASQRRAQFYASSPIFQSLPRQLGFTWGLAGGTAILTALFKLTFGVNAAPFIIPIVALMFLLTVVPTRVDVGVDGVLLRWLWKKQWIPMSSIVDVAASGDRNVNLTLQGGRTVTIHTSMSRSRGAFAQQRRDAVLARIREALAVHHAGGPAVDVAALVGKGARKPSEWLEALVKLRETAGYRAAVVRDEDLWRLVEDPAAPEDARAGAAVALRSGAGGLDDEGKARVRVAAEATASPKLRVLLDATAGESDEEATRAFDDLASEDEKRTLKAG